MFTYLLTEIVYFNTEPDYPIHQTLPSWKTPNLSSGLASWRKTPHLIIFTKHWPLGKQQTYPPATNVLENINPTHQALTSWETLIILSIKPFSPSLISLVVSVEVKHHAYSLTY